MRLYVDRCVYPASHYGDKAMQAGDETKGTTSNIPYMSTLIRWLTPPEAHEYNVCKGWVAW